jgi:hypothetical protein
MTNRALTVLFFAIFALSSARDLFAARRQSPQTARGQSPGAAEPQGVGPASPDRVAGNPWKGEPGITEAVGDIMERERHAPPVPPGQIREPKSWEFDLKNLQRRHDPSAPAASQWPLQDRFSSLSEPVIPQTVATSFLAARLAESGYIPPDSMGAVGPTQILAVVNGRIKVFSKAGALGALNATTDSFFGSVRNGYGTSDPHIRYDRLSGRWFVSMINVSGPNRVLLAVSSGSTITDTSSFTFFQFQHDQVGGTPNPDTGGFADYDTLGVDQSALYLGVNVFNSSGTALLGTTGFVVRKSDLLAGTLTVTAFRQLTSCSTSTFVCSAGPVTPQGVDNDDPGAAEGYFIGVDGASFSKLTMRRVNNPGGVPSISGNIAVAGSIPTTTYPIDQPALGSTRPLDALDDRLFAAAVHRNKTTGTSSLWTAHAIEVDASGAGVPGGGRNGARWYEIINLTSTPALNQAGTLFDSSASNPVGYWIPSVAMSGQGHMALGSSRAGTNNHAEIAVAGRLATDTPGLLQSPLVAQTSGTSYTLGSSSPQRWGDYSQVVVDPNDDMTMWTFQEYCDATNSWGLRVIELLAPPPATPAAASPPSLAQGASGNLLLTGTAVSGSGFFDPGSSFANRITTAVDGGGVTVNNVTYTDPTHITLNVTVSASATTGARTISVTNPDGQAATSAFGIFSVTPGTLMVAGVNPRLGSVSGGTPVVITGGNFQATPSVVIGGVPATGVVFVDATTLTAITGPHAAGAVDVVVTNPSTQFAALANGYTYGSSGFYAVAPCRVADTRDPSSPSGGPALTANAVRTFPVGGLCGIPSSATAVAVNLAVVLPSNSGDLRVYPAGGVAPLASAINFRAGIVRANNATVALGAGGQLSVQCDMPSGGTNFFFDVFGYYQ